MAKKILVVGSSNMDLSMNMYKVPAAGETVIDDGGVAYNPGGKGLNAAVAFKRLGADTVFSTRLGADMHGQKIYTFLKEVGINTSYVKADHTTSTGFAAVLKESDGQNRIIYYPGANITLTRDNISEAFSCQPDAVYINFEVSFDAALAAAKIASSCGIPLFIDAAPADKDHALEALPEIEVFSPNETETYEYTGILPVGADASLRAALALWKRIKAKYIVIKQGARGAFIYDGKHYSMIPSFRADKVVDSTAAGDVFTAEKYSEFLTNGKMDDGSEFGYSVEVVSIDRDAAGEYNAVIRITRQ